MFFDRPVACDSEDMYIPILHQEHSRRTGVNIHHCSTHTDSVSLIQNEKVYQCPQTNTPELLEILYTVYIYIYT